MGLGKVYRNPDGQGLMLLVRHEERKKVDGVLLAGTTKGVIYTQWIPADEAIPGELVNDTAGRNEAEVERLYAIQVERERDALKVAMKQAVSLLSPTQAEDLRKLYIKQLKGG